MIFYTSNFGEKLRSLTMEFNGLSPLVRLRQQVQDQEMKQNEDEKVNLGIKTDPSADLVLQSQQKLRRAALAFGIDALLRKQTSNDHGKI